MRSLEAFFRARECFFQASSVKAESSHATARQVVEVCSNRSVFCRTKALTGKDIYVTLLFEQRTRYTLINGSGTSQLFSARWQR